MRLRLGPQLDTYVPAPERQEPAQAKPLDLDQVIKPVQQEIRSLEQLCRTQKLPTPLKQQYEQAIGRLRKFVKEVKDGRDPQAAYRENIPAARQHLQSAQNQAAKLLQQQAVALLGRYGELAQVLSADEKQVLQPEIALLTKGQNGKLTAAEAKGLNAALAELQRKMPAVARLAAQRAQGKMLAAIKQVRGPLKELLAADEKVGAQGRAASSPWFGGIAYLLATNPAAHQGTTLADRRQATRNPEQARSVADLLMCLDQLETDIRSGKPIPANRLNDLQRIANSPVIAATQDAVKVGAVVEAAKVVAISSAIVVSGGFVGGIAAEAFAAYAGSGALVTLGALLVEGTVFTAVTVPLEYAVGIGELPDSGTEWAERVVTNAAMIGTFKVAGRAYETVAGSYRLTAPVLHEFGRLSTSFAAMNGFALGEQLVHGENPGLVFSWNNLGNQAVNSLPNFIGLELAGRASRPLLGPIAERVRGWKETRLQLRLPEITPREINVAELVAAEEQTVSLRTEGTEAGTKAERAKIVRPDRSGRGAVPEEVSDNPYERQLRFESPEEFLAFVDHLEGARPDIIARRAKLAAQDPSTPVYVTDARQQAQAIWDKMSTGKQTEVRSMLGGKEITPDRLIEGAGELMIRNKRDPDFAALLRIKGELFGMKMFTETIAARHGIKAEWLDRLLLTDHWFTSEISNFKESVPHGQTAIIGRTIGKLDTVVVPAESGPARINGDTLVGADGRINEEVEIKREGPSVIILDRKTGHVVDMGTIGTDNTVQFVGGSDTHHSLFKRFGRAAADRITGLRQWLWGAGVTVALDEPITLRKGSTVDKHNVDIPAGRSLSLKLGGVPVRLYNLRGAFYVQEMGDNPSEPQMVNMQKDQTGRKKMGMLSIGRAQDSDLVLSDSNVSSKHLTIVIENSKALIADTSRNGTLVDPQSEPYRPIGPNGGFIEKGLEFVNKEQAAKYMGGKVLVALENNKFAVVDAEVLPQMVVKNGRTASMTTAELTGYRDAYLRPLEQELAKATKLQLQQQGGAGLGFERPAISAAAAKAAGRPEMAGQAGALLRIKPKPGQKLIFIGDLHGNIGNLQRLVAEYGPKLEKGEVALVFLGDAIHEETGNINDISGSLKVTDTLLQLKNAYPDSVHYIKGNHDEVVSDVAKKFYKKINGVPVFQGIIFRDKLVEARGEEYAQALQAFFDASPRVVTFEAAGQEHYAAHCAFDPNKGTKISPDTAVNAAIDPKLDWSLSWSRPVEHYDQNGIANLRKSMGLAPNALVLVGHTHDPSGNGAAAWVPQGMPGHLVLMSNDSQALSVVEADGKSLKVKDLIGRSGLSR